MKKIIALLACLAMLLSMAACAGNTETPTEPSNEVTEPTNEVVEDPTEEVTEEPTDEIVEDPTEETPVAMEGTVGENLLAAFKANATGTAEEIANTVISNPIIQFMPMVMPIEAGLLNGFNETEITGFEEGAMFGPMIGTIPFIGYVFKLADGADVEAFKTLLTDNANLRWNICTSAEEMVCENEGNTVFFLMCPSTFEQPEVEGGDVGGMELLPEEGEGIVLG